MRITRYPSCFVQLSLLQHLAAYYLFPMSSHTRQARSGSAIGKMLICQRIGKIPVMACYRQRAELRPLVKPTISRMVDNSWLPGSDWFTSALRWGGKQVLLGISKRGDTYFEDNIIHGAVAVLQSAKHKTGCRIDWANQPMARRNNNIASVGIG